MQIGLSLGLTSNRKTPVAVGNTYATWNSADKAPLISLDATNLIVSNTAAAQYDSVRANQSKSAGKWVFELTKSTAAGTLILGFGTSAFTLIASWVGNSAVSASYQSANYLANGITAIGTAPADAITPFMIALDLDAGKGWIAVGNVWANTGDPAAGTNPSFTFTANSILFPACSVFGTAKTVTANFGASAFSNTVPSGFNSGWYI
jgi:hypothetical protein